MTKPQGRKEITEGRSPPRRGRELTEAQPMTNDKGMTKPQGRKQGPIDSALEKALQGNKTLRIQCGDFPEDGREGFDSVAAQGRGVSY